MALAVVCASRGGDLSFSGNPASRRDFVGRSCAFRSINETIETVASRKSSVIITGETGTGKEMIARQIHNLSDRKNKPFVPVDCTALSGQILESQLFGHVKGAFTGADRDTLGFFRAADGGTVFLDEIGELEVDLQAKLLRVLQDSAVTPVGDTKARPIDVRVVCATHRDLKKMIGSGDFRADLYFRLNVFAMEMPPLRDRRDDIQPLCEHFLQKQAELYDEPVKQLSPEANTVLEGYSWPGNVRELANAMEHAHVASRGREIGPADIPSDVLDGDIERCMQQDECLSFKELKKKLVVRALQKANGRKMATARLLEIDHRKLDRLVEQFGLKPTWK